MTKVLSFAEWVDAQDYISVLDMQEGCEQWVCALSPEPNCSWDEVKSCPLHRAYEQQKAQDLKKWEKWNSEALL